MLKFLILLSVLQGFTEFLPVSSSGHLAFVQNLTYFKSYKNMLGNEAMFTYDVFLHLATFMSILIFFLKDIIRIIKNDFRYIRGERKDATRGDFHLTLFIILANVPILIVGLLFKKKIELLFHSSETIFILFIINGLILISTYFIKTGSLKVVNMGWSKAILIGIAQCLAVLPGISRSGSTISAAFYFKIKPTEGARFSFLLGLPVIFGASLLEIFKILKLPGSFPFSLEIAIGMLIAFITGLVSLKILFWFVKKTVLYPFGIYTLLLGILGLLVF